MSNESVGDGQGSAPQNPPYPYIPKQGDVISYRYHGKQEHGVILHGDFTYMSINLRGWSRLGGRHITQIACSDPDPARSAPDRILVLSRFGTSNCAVKKVIPFPESLKAEWNAEGESDEALAKAKRRHAKLMYDISHKRPIDIDDPRIDELVQRMMTREKHRPWSTNI